MLMARKKSTRLSTNLLVVPTHVDPDHNGLRLEVDEGLRELIRSINKKSVGKKEREGGPQTEHDPDLPPAA